MLAEKIIIFIFGLYSSYFASTNRVVDYTQISGVDRKARSRTRSRFNKSAIQGTPRTAADTKIFAY